MSLSLYQGEKLVTLGAGSIYYISSRLVQSISMVNNSVQDQNFKTQPFLVLLRLKKKGEKVYLRFTDTRKWRDVNQEIYLYIIYIDIWVLENTKRQSIKFEIQAPSRRFNHDFIISFIHVNLKAY